MTDAEPMGTLSIVGGTTSCRPSDSHTICSTALPYSLPGPPHLRQCQERLVPKSKVSLSPSSWAGSGKSALLVVSTDVGSLHRM